MPVRETFWNIPHWAEIAQYVLGLLVLVILALGSVQHVRRWRMGRPEKRTDRIGVRLWAVVQQAFAQIRTLEDVYAGVMHLLIFWGMAALLLGTALATIDWEVTRLFFDFQFLAGGVYVVYELVLDILGLLLVIGLGMAAYRRYVIRPTRLKSSSRKRGLDDAYALIILGLIAVSGFLVEGLRIAATQPSWARWSPVGRGLASLFVNLQLADQQTFHVIIWIGHALVAFVFIASVPFTKFFHIFSAPVNIFFQALKTPGALAPVAQHSGAAGVRQWTDFTWKQILEFDTCLRCGRCAEHCPSYASGMTLSPMELMMKLRDHVWEPENGKSLYEQVVSPDEVWACATCYACAQVCPVFNDLVSTIVDMRRHLVLEGLVGSELQDALSSLGRYGNSFGQSPRMRARWTASIEPKIKDGRREIVDYLWFVGDYASYSPALTQIIQKTAFTKNDLPTLRHCMSAGEHLSDEMLAAWRERFGMDVYEAIGMSEISYYLSQNKFHPIRPGSAGFPQPGHARLIDLNPYVGRWYVLIVDWPGLNSEMYHLELYNTGSKLKLYSAGLAIDGNPCPLWAGLPPTPLQAAQVKVDGPGSNGASSR